SSHSNIFGALFRFVTLHLPQRGGLSEQIEPPCRGSSVVEEGTHKTLVASSNLAVGTDTLLYSRNPHMWRCRRSKDMFVSQTEQGISIPLFQSEELEHLIQAFLETKRAENVSGGTYTFYKNKLNLFHTFCISQGISQIYQIQADAIRQFMIFL